MEDDLNQNEDQFIEPLEDDDDLSLEAIKRQIEYQLTQFEPADMYILCRKLIERWKHVPPCSIMQIVNGGLLIPFSYSGVGYNTSITKSMLPTTYDKDNECERIDVDSAERIGVMFSLANVLLIENKFPRVFPRPAKVEKFSSPYDVIVRLMACKEDLELQVASLRGQLEDAQEALTHEMREANSIRRLLDRQQSWLEEAQALNREGSVAPPCDGQAFPRWLCARRRQMIPDRETVQILYKHFGFTQASAAFMVATPKEFNVEADRAEKGIPLSDANRRGTYRGIVTGTNKERKKNQSMERKKTEEEDGGEDYV